MSTYLLRQISTGEIKARNISEADAHPIGLNPDYEYLEAVDDPQPDVVKGERAVRSEFQRGKQWVNGWKVEKLTAEELAADEAQRIAEIKAEARRRILARIPDWKQSNMIAGAVEMLAAGQTIAPELAAGWAWVKSVRAYSDTLEADPTKTADDGGWPE